MASALWPRSGDSFRTVTGAAYAGALALFYDGGTTSPRQVYQDSALTTPWGSTVTADANGLFPAVYLPQGEYNFRVQSTTGGLIFEAGPIDPMPQPSTTTGGDIDPDDYRATGDLQPLLQSGPKANWVRLNGKSIGNAVSGATERANADTEALFAYLYALPDSVAAVSGGRGASAAADYAANKTLTLPSARGRALFGVDDMGNSAAGLIQTTANLTTTAASVTATVASVVGIAIGMIVIASGVVTNTVVTNINNLTLTLSAPATVTQTTTARFSMFADAQQVGATAGSGTHRMSLPENAQHDHVATSVVTDPGHFHTSPQAGGATTAAPGATAGFAATGSTMNTDTKTTGITVATSIDDAGEGADHNNMPGALLVTVYIKL